MDYRMLGHSPLKVSRLSLGSWNTFEFMAPEDALAVMSAAIRSGINFLDDARYDDTSGRAPMKTGYSEVVFGNLLRAGGFKRDELVISNRMWFEFFPKESFEAEIDGSLSRIGIDYFDLVFCFTPPKELAPAELVGQLADLVATGKIRHWASGNWPIELLAECCAIAKRAGAPLPPAAMVPYSLSIRSFVENDAMGTLCHDYDIGLVASFALHGGILTGKYNSPTARESRRYDAKRLEEARHSGLLEKSARFVALARERGYTPAQLAYAYCLRHPRVASVLFGATSTAQVEENVSALEIVGRLDDELLARLDAIFPKSET
jgi:aryl-alcohol dehydrogenase-like predicted oxidoreductase